MQICASYVSTRVLKRSESQNYVYSQSLLFLIHYTFLDRSTRQIVSFDNVNIHTIMNMNWITVFIQIKMNVTFSGAATTTIIN